MSKYTWPNFLRYNENPDVRFEELSRWIFIRKFNDNNPDLESSPNNAGIETEPIKYDGKLYGFQAKYTSSTFPYADFHESISKTIAYYEGKLDVYVVLCNKKSTKTSKSYLEMKSELKSKNIDLIEISGEHLLDYLTKEDDNFFLTQFFDEIILKDSFYTNQVNQAIEDLGGRYHPRINIETEIERSVAFVYKSEKAIETFKKNLIGKCIELENKNIILSKIVNSKSHLTKIRKILIEFDKCSWKDIENIHKSYMFLTNECNNILSELDSKTDDKQKMLRSETYLFLSLLREFNLLDNVAINSIFRRVVFVYGEAGTGKSHLLAKTALNALEEGHHTLLLLGNQFIEQSPIENQILSLLNITNISFEEFLDRLNHQGIRERKRVLLIIDAINESNYNSIWKTFLNKLISSVKKREKVCLVISYRSTFEKLVLSDEVIRKIDSDITLYEHLGFIDITEEAIEKYFEYHQIPYTISMHLEQAFENPLFLVTYCKLWNIKQGEIQQPINLYEILDDYIAVLDKKLKDLYQELPDYNVINKILKSIASKMFSERVNNLGISSVISLFPVELKDYDKRIIRYMKDNELIHSYVNAEDESIYISYQAYYEFNIANFIIDSCAIQKTEILIKELLINKDGRPRYDNIGIFSILATLLNRRLQLEILEFLPIEAPKYFMSNLETEYIKSYIYRFPNEIKINYLSNHVNEQNQSVYFDLLMRVAIRPDNPLNILYFHKKLIKMPMNERDYFWTLYLTDDYNENGTVKKIVSSLLKRNYSIDVKTARLAAFYLCWLFGTPSINLRTYATFSLKKVFIEHPDIALELIKEFVSIDDNYILQSLTSAIFGALVSMRKISLPMIEIGRYLFNTMFDQEEVKLDVIIRDNCRNIVDYLYNNSLLKINRAMILPPYSSKKIDFNVDDTFIESLNLKPNEKFFHSGLRMIKHSMYPNTKGMLYGDFGRYVFQSVIEQFKGIDAYNMFVYAMKLIKDKYGYVDNFFTDFDTRYNSIDRHSHRSNTERIGKKYQWIALSEISALLADHNLFGSYYDKGDYEGPWQIYLRNDDYTIAEQNNPNKVNIDCERKYFKELKDINDDWISKDDYPLFESLLMVDDYILLYKFINLAWGDYRDVHYDNYIMAHSYFVDSSKYPKTISQITKKSYWNRWMPEGQSFHNLYYREFYWSEAFDKLFYKDENDIKPTWLEYNYESLNSSVEKENLYLPSYQLAKHFNLKQNENSGELIDKKGVVVCKNIESDTGKGLYIKKDYLKKYLLDNNQKIFWTGLSEKLIGGDKRLQNVITSDIISRTVFEVGNKYYKIENHHSINDEFLSTNKVVAELIL